MKSEQASAIAAHYTKVKGTLNTLAQHINVPEPSLTIPVFGKRRLYLPTLYSVQGGYSFLPTRARNWISAVVAILDPATPSSYCCSTLYSFPSLPPSLSPRPGFFFRL